MLVLWLLCTALADIIAVDSKGASSGEGGRLRFAFPYDGAEISVGRHTSLGVRLSYNLPLPTGCTCCLTMFQQIQAERKSTFNGCAPFPFTNPPALTEQIGEGTFWLDAQLLSAEDVQLAEAHTVKFTVAGTAVESSQIDPPRSLIIDTKALLSANKLKYAHLVHDTYHAGFPVTNRQDLGAQPGVEPYALLAHLAGQLTESTIIDLGTHFGVSAFVLASSHPSNTVLSYDVDDREAAIAQQNDMTRQQVQREPLLDCPLILPLLTLFSLRACFAEHILLPAESRSAKRPLQATKRLVGLGSAAHQPAHLA